MTLTYIIPLLSPKRLEETIPRTYLGSFSQEEGQTKCNFLWQKFQVLHAFLSPSISSLSPSFLSSFLFSLTGMLGYVSRHAEGRQVTQDKDQSFLRSFKGREAKIYTMLKKAPRAAVF